MCSFVVAKICELENKNTFQLNLSTSFELENEDNDSDSSLMEQSDENTGKQFLNVRHAAYVPVVISVLQQLLRFSDQQFAQNKQWVVSCLTKLVLCDDLQIRILVCACFSKFVERVFRN